MILDPWDLETGPYWCWLCLAELATWTEYEAHISECCECKRS